MSKAIELNVGNVYFIFHSYFVSKVVPLGLLKSSLISDTDQPSGGSANKLKGPLISCKLITLGCSGRSGIFFSALLALVVSHCSLSTADEAE